MKSILKGKWVFDTNILIYAQNKDSEFYPAARSLFELLIASDKKEEFIGVIALQNIIEAENVLIKQYNFSYREAIKAIEDVLGYFPFTTIVPKATTYKHFHMLMEKSEKSSLDIYDYFLAATMLDNKTTNIITANEKDFAGIKEITVYNPWGK